MKTQNLNLFFVSFLLLLLLLSPWTIVAQDLATVVRPSPQAANLGKYGDWPVSTYTGVPNISIPLHTITYRDISIPISINYHASGVRVEEEAGPVGLGWSLNAGGMISRTVYGRDDLNGLRKGFPFTILDGGNDGGRIYTGTYDTYNGYPFDEVPGVFESNKKVPWVYLQEYVENSLDPEPDIFQYSFLGFSGKFVFEPGQALDSLVTIPGITAQPSMGKQRYLRCRTLEGSDITILYDPLYNSWLVVDGSGYQYMFRTIELTETHTASCKGGKDCSPGSLNWANADAVNITAWYLDKIVSPTNTEVTLSYDVLPIANGGDYSLSPYLSQSQVRTDLTVSELFSATPVNRNGVGQITTGCWGLAAPYGTLKSQQASFRTPVYLKEISTPFERVEFFKSSREDLLYGYDPGDDKRINYFFNGAYRAPQRYTGISVFDANNTVTKSITFDNNHYFNPGGDASQKRLKLEQVQECGATSADCINPYRFFYNEQFALPAKNSYAQDFWGFYNGEVDNPSLVPTGTYITPGFDDDRVFFIGDANRQPSASHMQAGILSKIQYPTCGVTEFEFEPNDYSIFGEGAFYITDFNKKLPGVSVKGSINSVSGTKEELFYLPSRCQVTFTRYIEYPYCNYYAGNENPCIAIDPLPAFNNNPSEVYLRFQSLSGGGNSFNNTYSYAEYYQAWQAGCDPNGPGELNCRFSHTEQLTLNAGLYKVDLINLSPGPGSPINLSVGYSISCDDIIETSRAIPLDEDRQVYAKTGGGLRIKSITSSAYVGDPNPLIKRYEYVREENNKTYSSGRLMLFPNFHGVGEHTSHHVDNGNCYVILRSLMGYSRNTNVVSSRSQGNVVGYDRILEYSYQDGSEGYTEYLYQNQEESVPDINSSNNDGITNFVLPGYPTITHTDNGLLKEQRVYDHHNNLLSKTVNTYKTQDLGVTKGVLIENRASTLFNGFYKAYELPHQQHYLDEMEEINYEKREGAAVYDSIVNRTIYHYETVNNYQRLDYVETAIGDKDIAKFPGNLNAPDAKVILSERVYLDEIQNCGFPALQACITTFDQDTLICGQMYRINIPTCGDLNGWGDNMQCQNQVLQAYYDCYRKAFYKLESCRNANSCAPIYEEAMGHVYNARHNMVQENTSALRNTITSDKEYIATQKTDYIRLDAGLYIDIPPYNYNAFDPRSGYADILAPQTLYAGEFKDPEPQGTYIADNHYSPRAEILYDQDNANVWEQKKVHDIPTSYLWGYNKSLPVAEIVGASRAEVEAAFSNTVPSFSNGMSASEESTLRAYFADRDHVLVTTYTYTPHLGITKMTDPNGNMTLYEYDPLNRLKLVRYKTQAEHVADPNAEGVILKRYEYHYGDFNTDQ